MNIAHPAAFCKPASANLNAILGNSNTVPSIWYHKVLLKNGKPDNVGITILSELLRLHLSSETKELTFSLSYSHLKARFNYTHEQIYEAFLRLEVQKLISREGKLVTFNVENVLALSTEQKGDDNNGNAPKKTKSYTDKNTQDESLNRYLYIDDTKRDIEDKREENYISGTSFSENSTAQKPYQGNNPESKPEGIIGTAKKWVKNLKPKSIASFHPLTEEDAESLRLVSGREFNLNFINQLVSRLGDKYPNHSFYTKKIFLKYMATLLANEMRQAVNVNNEGFRFKRNDEEGAIEQYLNSVEDGYDNKASDRIRKKVAAAFEPNVAYKILTSCYFPDETCNGKYEIKQRQALELSESQRERLFSQISAVFGEAVSSIEIIKNSYTVAKPQQIATSATSLDVTTLWGRVRSGLIASYGEAIDKSWFSRLETTEDASSRSLILRGASFLTDYIQTNYSHVIERLCAQENYQLKFTA